MYFTNVQHSYNYSYKARTDTNIKLSNRSGDYWETHDPDEEE